MCRLNGCVKTRRDRRPYLTIPTAAVSPFSRLLPPAAVTLVSVAAVSRLRATMFYGLLVASTTAHSMALDVLAIVHHDGDSTDVLAGAR